MHTLKVTLGGWVELRGVHAVVKNKRASAVAPTRERC